jgi:alpha-beta hydrolase superfamily lysophospholipase
MTRRLTAIAFVVLATFLVLGSRPVWAGSRAHVYLFRGLADIFSTGMDVLTDELNKRGVYATSHSHTEWKALAEQAAANYKAGKEGPIILIGHSLGADAVMEMADYLGDKGVPVALVMPFDGTQSFAASGNVARVINFTQRDYAYMRKGAGFRGTLVNVDVSSDPDIGHLNIDKSPRLHARAISEVLAVAAGHMGLPTAAEKQEKPVTPPPAANAVRHDNTSRSEEQREPAFRTAPARSEPADAEPARGIAPARPETSAQAPANIAPAAPMSSPVAPAAPVNPGMAGPAFPPQPPPVRLAPAKPLDIPD